MYVTKYTAEVAFLRMYVEPQNVRLSERDVMADGTPRVVWEFPDTTEVRALARQFHEDTVMVSPKQYSRAYGDCNREMREIRQGLRSR